MAQAAAMNPSKTSQRISFVRQLTLLMRSEESVHDPDCILCNHRLRQASPLKNLSLNRKLRNILYPTEKR